MATFFTSDLHFGHKNVIPYCNRPFESVEAMNEGLIERWNRAVGETDDVWILGDYCFGGSRFIADINRRLHGKKHLLRGNHDWGNVKTHRLDLGFTSIVDGKRDFKLKGPNDTLITVTGSHFPYRGTSEHDTRYEDKKPIDQGLWLLHGHVHCAWLSKGKMVNVGTDVWGYMPVSEETLVDFILKLERGQEERAAQVFTFK